MFFVPLISLRRCALRLAALLRRLEELWERGRKKIKIADGEWSEEKEGILSRLL